MNPSVAAVRQKAAFFSCRPIQNPPGFASTEAAKAKVFCSPSASLSDAMTPPAVLGSLCERSPCDVRL